MFFRRYSLRLTLLLLPWLVILVVPRFRLQLGLTVSGQRLAFYGTPWTRIFNPFPSHGPTPDAAAPGSLEEEALDIAGGVGASEPRERWKILQFGRFSDRHPREAWIIALALRQMSSTRDGRVEYMKADSWQYGYPNFEKNGYTPSMVREGLRLVRRGQSLEPDNAFFDWAEIHLLLVQRRDQQALELLQRAVRKPVYNEHIGEVMRAHITEQEALRPLLADERVLIAGGIQFPDWSLSRHVRGTLIWRLDQLEDSHRHEEAIAAGRALRRLSIMQLRASPFWMGSAVAGSGLYGVWTGGDRKWSKLPKATVNLLRNDEKRRTNFIAQRYFQYLSKHGHRELLPEAREQFAEYQAMLAMRTGWNRSSFFDPYENAPLALSNVAWSLGGWCFAGFLLSGLSFLVLLPVGLRGALREQRNWAWPPPRASFYPQLVGWGGVALCMSYACYLQVFENRVLSCTPDTVILNAASMVWSYVALALPFAAALASQKFGVRGQPQAEVPEARWAPDWRQLGMPEQIFPILSGSWRAFTVLLGLVGVLCAPVSLAGLVWSGPRDWGFLAPVDIFFLRVYLPPIEIVQFVTPVLLVIWVLFQVSRWVVCTRRTERAVTVRSIRDFRRCCGSYAIVFSWLLLVALMANLPLQAQLDSGLGQFLAQAAQRSQVNLREPAPLPKAVRELPPIPVFPTPTPYPPGMVAP